MLKIVKNAVSKNNENLKNFERNIWFSKEIKIIASMNINSKEFRIILYLISRFGFGSKVRGKLKYKNIKKVKVYRYATEKYGN